MSFSQLPVVKKDTKNDAPGNFFGPSYFVTALIISTLKKMNELVKNDKSWRDTEHINLHPIFSF